MKRRKSGKGKAESREKEHRTSNEFRCAIQEGFFEQEITEETEQYKSIGRFLC